MTSIPSPDDNHPISGNEVLGFIVGLIVLALGSWAIYSMVAGVRNDLKEFKEQERIAKELCQIKGYDYDSSGIRKDFNEWEAICISINREEMPL